MTTEPSDDATMLESQKSYMSLQAFKNRLEQQMPIKDFNVSHMLPQHIKQAVEYIDVWLAIDPDDVVLNTLKKRWLITIQSKSFYHG